MDVLSKIKRASMRSLYTIFTRTVFQRKDDSSTTSLAVPLLLEPAGESNTETHTVEIAVGPAESDITHTIQKTPFEIAELADHIGTFIPDLKTFFALLRVNRLAYDTISTSYRYQYYRDVFCVLRTLMNNHMWQEKAVVVYATQKKHPLDFNMIFCCLRNVVALSNIIKLPALKTFFAAGASKKDMIQALENSDSTQSMALKETWLNETDFETLKFAYESSLSTPRYMHFYALHLFCIITGLAAYFYIHYHSAGSLMIGTFGYDNAAHSGDNKLFSTDCSALLKDFTGAFPSESGAIYDSNGTTYRWSNSVLFNNFCVPFAQYCSASLFHYIIQNFPLEEPDLTTGKMFSLLCQNDLSRPFQRFLLMYSIFIAPVCILASLVIHCNVYLESWNTTENWVNMGDKLNTAIGFFRNQDPVLPAAAIDADTAATQAAQQGIAH